MSDLLEQHVKDAEKKHTVFSNEFYLAVSDLIWNLIQKEDIEVEDKEEIVHDVAISLIEEKDINIISWRNYLRFRIKPWIHSYFSMKRILDFNIPVEVIDVAYNVNPERYYEIKERLKHVITESLRFLDDYIFVSDRARGIYKYAVILSVVYDLDVTKLRSTLLSSRMQFHVENFNMTQLERLFNHLKYLSKEILL
jgi:hypothetical protein